MARTSTTVPLPSACLVALLGLGAIGTAQTPAKLHRSLTAPPRHATLNLATGELTRDDEKSTVPLVTVWANTDYSGFFTFPAPGEEWLDWGFISTTSGSDIVGRFTFGYATLAPSTGPGAAICTSFYDGALGYCSESGQGLLPIANFCFSGLPGTSTVGVPALWVVDVITTGGHEFEVGAGPFGFALSGFDSVTGPLLCYSDGATTNALDAYVPDVATGTCATFSLGTPPYDHSTFFTAIRTADGNNGPRALAIPRNGTGVNPHAYWATPPILGGVMDAYVVPPGLNVGALIAGYDTPLTGVTPWGELLVDTTSAGGELLGLPSGFGIPTTISLPVPINLALCGRVAYTQAVGFGGGITLLNAVDVRIGF